MYTVRTSTWRPIWQYLVVALGMFCWQVMSRAKFGVENVLDELDRKDSDAEVEEDVDEDGVSEELRTILIDPLDREQGVFDGDLPLHTSSPSSPAFTPCSVYSPPLYVGTVSPALHTVFSLTLSLQQPCSLPHHLFYLTLCLKQPRSLPHHLLYLTLSLQQPCSLPHLPELWLSFEWLKCAMYFKAFTVRLIWVFKD